MPKSLKMVTRKESFEGYERIKAIGKGAFGTAVLYKRLSDNKDVVIKEVFLSDMTDSEKQLAFNEANVLASLNHPNIIRYMGRFEKDGSLLIEMEYADNGNLAQLINLRRERKKMFREKDILEILLQITSAISYMHLHKILHRDLKAANIFLNKSGTIKIGDFGISKIMTTRAQAQTVVGTPYYLSPEMCEFDDIPDIYSKNLSELVRDILQKDFVNRPSAQHIHDVIIPSFPQFSAIHSETRRHSLTSTNKRLTDRSILYHLNGFGDDADLSPVELPHKKIISFSSSATHFIVVTLDCLVYTWGKDSFGQLAHGNTDIWRKYPICVEYLRGKNIIKCAAGEGFSVFLNNNGLIFTCGDGRQGCLGHSNWNSLLRPTIIDSLITRNVVDVCCGSKHLLALTADSRVYSWGSSSNGQLGLGHEKFCCTPTLIKLPNEYVIHKIFAESNSSALLESSGRILVCGSNVYNKLGIKKEANVLNFQILRILKDKITNISMSINHTILITENGKVIGMGKNTEGQLGIGNCTTYSYPQTICAPQNIVMVSCGPTYTAVATENNAVYVWGTYHRKSISATSPEIFKKLPNYNSSISCKSNVALQKVSEISFSAVNSEETNVAELIKKPRSILA